MRLSVGYDEFGRSRTQSRFTDPRLECINEVLDVQ